MGKVELLAPAGDMTCFKAAVNAGADAVYLGGEEYGARAYASNFARDELCQAIRYAHLFGVKVYLTVNTIVKERELKGLCSFIEPFYQAGLDGVIVQDFGVLKIIKEAFPGLLIHGSTQMCVTGKYGAALLKEYGVCRIVPARELSLEEIKEIKKETGIEIETFIHGAMCYSYSGQCLFSSFLGGRSGNRGRCAGPCRLPYSAFGKKEVYPLSLKDMCTLPILHELIEAGIDSFKIEGRMKNPYYVAGVTAVYRKYIDLYKKSFQEGAEYQVDKKDLDLLRSLYVRTELETGYYHQHNGAQMITLQKPGYVTGDEKDFAWLKKRYLDCDKKINLECELTAYIGKVPQLTVWNKEGKRVVKEGENLVSKALNRPVTVTDVEKQLSKTGNTPFDFQTISVIMDEDVFIPLKEINELRRQALDEMKCQLAFAEGRNGYVLKNTADVSGDGTALYTPGTNDRYSNVRDNNTHNITAAVTTMQQLNAVLSFQENLRGDFQEERRQDGQKLTGIQLHFSLLEKLAEDKHLTERITEIKDKHGLDIYFSMPQVCRKRAIDYCSRFLTDKLLGFFDGFYCGNLDALGYITKRLGNAGISFDEKEILADYSLYTCNSEAVSFLKEYHITGLTASYELNRYEWEELLAGCSREKAPHIKTEYQVYGHIPFMQSAGCVKKTFDRCDGKNAVTILTDRMGKRLPVMNFCQICENTVYNGIPLSLYKEMKQIICDRYRISFTIENERQTEEILNSFLLNTPLPFSEYTKGHFKKGIE